MDTEFKKQILGMVKQKQADQLQENHLSQDKMNRVEDNVYAHIDSLFPASPQEASHTVKTKTVFSRIKDFISDLHHRGNYQTVAALAAIPVLIAGVIAYQSNNLNNSVYPTIPDSLKSHGLAQFIEIPAPDSRAIADLSITDRRRAFITGIAKADLDTTNDPESEIAKLVNTQFGKIINSNADNSSVNLIDDSFKQAFTQDDTRAWAIQGYALEIVHLSASMALENIDASVVNEALKYYQETSGKLEITEDNSIPVQFSDNHDYLVAAAKAKQDTPDKIQILIDKTQQMKLIIR